MSVLIVGATRTVGGMNGADLVARLAGQGDEVRVLDRPSRRFGLEEMRRAGAHVASGDLSDDDLIERAAQNVRTLFLLSPDLDGVPDEVDAAVTGAVGAEVERVVVCCEEAPLRAGAKIRSAGIQYAIVVVGRTRKIRRPRLPPAAIARALDAADDLAGDVRLDLDLRDQDSWEALRIEPPI